MAKAIKTIEPIKKTQEEIRKEALEEIQDALVDNKEAVLGTIDMMKNLEKSGVTRFLNGLFSEADQVLEVVVQEAAKEENTNALRNALLLMGTLGTIDMKQIEPLLLKVNNGVARVAENPDPEKKTGYVELMKKLKDPEVNRSLTILVRFLEGMGQTTEEEERN
ncbi:DUF1641 domain-containing protein [Alkalicoccus daliensis]|uniref:Uncharacterized conserved protein YjgD, DUF1641 family n=1 Tax=Alkalicoccus daliensis TaxID=745820 RepID=A0A1H0JP21_9BACI|nr:DUF1641 domain-containing protein [Alkalicoccus daliensis]SDO45496.1 Uncharacterized conserved protein YjgD, DUF1641 family [Alkalicoccus daliensis]